MSSFPSHLIDPKKKNSQWIESQIKAIWQDFRGVYPSAFYNGRDKYHEIKQYMTGKQSIEKYKKVLDPQKTASGDTSWLNINWSILPIIPKYRRIALGNLNKMDFNITAQAVDPLSQDDRDDYYGDLATKITLRKEFEAAGLDPDQIDLDGNKPHTIEELDMHMKYSYKHQMAIEFEMALDVIFKQNDFAELRKQVVRDMFDYGIGGYREYFDSNGSIKIRRVDPANAVIGYAKKDNFSDAQYAGEIMYLSISELKQMAGNQLSEKQYEDVVDKTGSTNPKGRNNLGGYNEESETNKLEVLDVEFYSVNESVTEHRTNSKGNKVVGRAPYNKRNSGRSDREYKRISYKVVYTGKWVVGTDYYFDCKLQTNMKRAKKNYTDTKMSYHLYSTDLYVGTSASLGSQMIVIADEIQKAYYKLQNAIIRAKPSGITIDLSALENISFGRGGVLEPIEIIDFYNQTGNLPWRSTELIDGRQSNVPVSPIANGIGDEANRWFEIISNNIQLLRDILGFNEITDGSTPDPRMLKGVAAMAAQSTNNSLAFIKDADRYLTEQLAYNLSMRIQDAAKFGTLSGYTRAVGSNSIEFFKVNPDISLRDLGVFIENKPNDDEKVRVEQMLNEAIKADQMTYADAIAIRSVDNVKLQDEMIAYRIEKHLDRRQKEAIQMQQQNGQIQQQSAMAAEEEKRKTLQMDTQSELAQIQAAHKAKMEQIQLSKMLDKEIAMINSNSRVKQDHIKAESNEIIAEIKTLFADRKAQDKKDQ